MTMPLWQRTALEAFGTGFLAFTVGRLGSSEFNGFEQAIVIGLCLALLIHLIGRATGAHFNPAVTLLLNALCKRELTAFSSEKRCRTPI